MAIYSQHFSALYDSLMEDYEGIIPPTQRLVYEYTQDRQHLRLLELGCGTGKVLNAFPDTFELYGLDIAPGMLAVARKRLKRVTFFEGDMSNFHLNKKFDVVISVFDSINHLLEFTQWESMFACVAKHLKKGGVFIFDMNTQERHQTLANLPAQVKKVNDALVCAKIIQTGKNIYSARFEVFTNRNEKEVSLFEEQIPEASFPLKRVKKALQKHFTIEKVTNRYKETVKKDEGRIFFVCRKI